jgi:hypothetical protein
MSKTTLKESRRMAARVGIEPIAKLLQAFLRALVCESGKNENAQIDAQDLEELCQVLRTWPKLGSDMRRALRAMMNASVGGGR